MHEVYQVLELWLDYRSLSILSGPMLDIDAKSQDSHRQFSLMYVGHFVRLKDFLQTDNVT